MTLRILTDSKLDGAKPILVALTGGIGSGKSTVAAQLRELGALVVSADELARQVVAPGTVGLERVVEAFGEGFRTPDGSLHRAMLAQVVFADPEKLRVLESITHPLIQELQTQAFAGLGPGQVGVYDVPLLTERGDADSFDRVIVVEAPRERRLERLMERGLPQQDALKRMEAQATDAQRRALADYVVNNAGDLQQLRYSVRALGQVLGLIA